VGRSGENKSEGERVRLSFCIHCVLSPPRSDISVHFTSFECPSVVQDQDSRPYNVYSGEALRTSLYLII
jgi:hypothetical protein